MRCGSVSAFTYFGKIRSSATSKRLKSNCHIQPGLAPIPLAAQLVQEVGQFVAANWTELQDSDTSSTYFFNQITHRIQFDQPIQPQRVCYLLLLL